MEKRYIRRGWSLYKKGLNFKNFVSQGKKRIKLNLKFDLGGQQEGDPVVVHQVQGEHYERKVSEV